MKRVWLHVSLVLLFMSVISEAKSTSNSMLINKYDYKTLEIANDLNIPKKKGDYSLASPFGDESEIK